MKYCKQCGAQNEDNDKFCGSCGAALDAAEATATETAATEDAPAPAQKEPATGAKGKITATRDKALGFEKKHSIIANAIIAVCSIVIMFVALFAPIKVMAYELKPIQDDVNTAHYAEVDQTVWDMLGAIGYIGLDSKDLNDVIKMGTIEMEYQMAIAAGGDDVEKMAENLSGINYLAYLMSHYGANGFGEMFGGLGGPAFITLVFGLVVTLLSLITAIISLVYLIFAIIGVVKKKTTKNPFKYLAMTTALSISALALTAIMPMGKPGGGMMGIFIFSSLLMLILGAGYSLIMGKAGLLQVIKKSVISLVMFIGICLLFTNTVMYKAGVNYSYNVPFGYGIYTVFAAIASGAEGGMGIMIGGAVISAFSASVIAGAGKALDCMLKSLVGIKDKTDNDKAAFTNSIMTVIFGVVAIVFAFVGAPLIAKSMNNLPVTPEATTLLRAQMYVMLAFTLVAAIVMKAFNPKKDNKLFDEPALETADGAPAPEAATESVSSVEDVKAPEIEEKTEAPANDDVAGL